MLPWVSLLRRIQKASKLVHISVPVSDVEPLLRELSPKGLMIETWCATEDEARTPLRKAFVWTKERVQALKPSPLSSEKANNAS